MEAFLGRFRTACGHNAETEPTNNTSFRRAPAASVGDPPMLCTLRDGRITAPAAGLFPPEEPLLGESHGWLESAHILEAD
jgi:hypothetical protein